MGGLTLVPGEGEVDEVRSPRACIELHQLADSVDDRGGRGRGRGGHGGDSRPPPPESSNARMRKMVVKFADEEVGSWLFASRVRVIAE